MTSPVIPDFKPLRKMVRKRDEEAMIKRQPIPVRARLSSDGTSFANKVWQLITSSPNLHLIATETNSEE